MHCLDGAPGYKELCKGAFVTRRPQAGCFTFGLFGKGKAVKEDAGFILEGGGDTAAQLAVLQKLEVFSIAQNAV